MSPPRLILVLSENWTLTSPRDLRALVRIAVEAEAAGVDAVMLSEHVVLGPASGADGIMGNPRDYAAPGNQDPATPWPDSIVLASAIASATTNLRIALAAVIFPLRHPLLIAKQLATLDLLSEGRLVVQPTVSWHEQEYEALGVPFHRRGAILDEQLEAMTTAWRDTPAAHAGEHFSFADVYLEPKPVRAPGTAHVVRRPVAAPGAAAAPRPLRRWLPSVRLAYCCRAGSAADCTRRGRPRRRRARAGWAASAGHSRTTRARPISRTPPRRFRVSSHRDTRRSASSRRCSRTTSTRSGALCRELVDARLGLLTTSAAAAAGGYDAWGTSSTLAAARSTAARSCASSARGPLRWLSGATPE